MIILVSDRYMAEMWWIRERIQIPCQSLFFKHCFAIIFAWILWAIGNCCDLFKHFYVLFTFNNGFRYYWCCCRCSRCWSWIVVRCQYYCRYGADNILPLSNRTNVRTNTNGLFYICSWIARKNGRTFTYIDTHAQTHRRARAYLFGFGPFLSDG